MTQLRNQYVADAIQTAGPDAPLTVEHIARFLPDDFELDETDLAEFRPVEAVPEPEAAPIEGLAAKAYHALALKHALQGQPPAVAAEPEPAPAPVAPADIEAATARRIASDSLVAEARQAVMVAANVERKARTELAKAITGFQAGFVPITPEQLRRDFVREQQAIRQAQKDGTLPVRDHGPGIGKSVVDRTAYAQRGNYRAGNFRRGASTVKGMPNFDPRRGPVAKLPSQR